MSELCKGCGKEIRWARTENGKGIPLDPEPVPNGNLVLTHLEPGAQMLVRYVAKGEDTGIAPRYRTHFSTCEKADEFRKRKTG